MKHLRMLLIISLLGGIAFCAHPIRAQKDAAWIYALVSSNASDGVVALNPADDDQVTLLNVDKAVDRTSEAVFRQRLPQGETDALDRYVASLIGSVQVSGATARIDSIAVSPDGQRAIAEIIYEKWYNRYSVGFGTTQLILLDRTSGEQRLLLNLGFHDASLYLSSYPSPTPYYAEIGVARIDWTMDQHAVLIGVTDGARRSPPRYTIVALPINGAEPVRVAEGITWVVAPDSHHLTALGQGEVTGLPNALKRIDFDLNTGQTSETLHELGTWYIYYDGRLVYLGERVMFVVSHDNAMLEGGGGLAVFDPHLGTASFITRNLFHRLQSTPDGTKVVLETSEHTLVEAVATGDAITLQPLLSTPVTDWKLGSDGDLLVQFSGETAYQILDGQGRSLATLDLAEQVRLQAAPGDQEVKVVAVDW